ncbi:aldehyde dehydrogenase family protein [Daejeonella oryzae]|uniref:aldehyde dehydrogenase family protein n=1 Tax=Daejeonella oryzae TaxID=1122943 RepID=UPI000413D998|nr:aldehyde dehydrogenase family protein [Daejeonella oryzae]
MKQNIPAVFELQKAHSLTLRNTSALQRINKLRKLKAVIEAHEKEIYAALYADLRKSEFEAAFSEVYFSYGEIDFAIKNLSGWMKPKKVAVTMTSILTKSRIYYEPKGTSLIIAPWNYPFQLLISPLISAIAAGNCAILKPSEISVATSALIFKMITDNFDVSEIACFEGDVEVSKALLELPFDHIFFTGGTQVGKVVMAAAAKNLTSVTLELGGKSPVIIDEHINLQKAAEKIVWGKFMNAGQTCIAPDYILIKKEQEEEFVRHASEAIDKMYRPQGKLDKGNYGKIINEKNFNRLSDLLKDAVSEGATIRVGGSQNSEDATIEPTLLSAVNPQSKLMQEEIFGPLLPILNYRNTDEAINFVNRRQKPLALYIFSDDKEVTGKILKNTSAGGTAVNDVLVHISNPNLPFGGVNSSGTGSCHGFFGFKAFSHERAVLFQSSLNFNKMIYPPFNQKSGILKWLKKLM